MIELIRNCQHGSEIATYLREDSPGVNAIIKTATTPDGMADLRKEYEGWQWYQRIRYPHRQTAICKIVQENPRFLKVETEYIEALKGDYRKGLPSNAPILEKVMDQYCALWPCDQRGAGPIHGDLSIENILINGEGVHVIDWEHFNLEGGPWGFDLVYLFFETLWFGMRKRKEPARREVEILSACLKRVFDTGRINPEIIAGPLHFIRNYITGHPEIWGKFSKNPAEKFPIFHFSTGQATLIDRLLQPGFKA